MTATAARSGAPRAGRQSRAEAAATQQRGSYPGTPEPSARRCVQPEVERISSDPTTAVSSINQPHSVGLEAPAAGAEESPARCCPGQSPSSFRRPFGEAAAADLRHPALEPLASGPRPQRQAGLERTRRALRKSSPELGQAGVGRCERRQGSAAGGSSVAGARAGRRGTAVHGAGLLVTARARRRDQGACAARRDDTNNVRVTGARRWNKAFARHQIEPRWTGFCPSRRASRWATKGRD